LKHFINFLTKQDWVLFLVIVKNSKQPAFMILQHGLIKNFLTITRNSQWMFKTRFLPIFAHFSIKYLFIEFNGPTDGSVEAQVVSIIFLKLFLDAFSQHLCTSINYIST